MRKRVVVFFALLFLFVFILGSFHLLRFGGITGFSILDSGLSNNALDDDSRITERNENSFILNAEESEGIYESEIIDFGSEAVLNRIEWEGEIPKGRILYGFKEGSYAYTFDEWEHWSAAEDEGIISRIENSKVKGDLVEKFNSDIKFKVRLCYIEDCSDGNFTEVEPEKIFLNGRYLQYSIELKTTHSFVNPRVDKVIFYYSTDGETGGQELSLERNDFSFGGSES